MKRNYILACLILLLSVLIPLNTAIAAPPDDVEAPEDVVAPETWEQVAPGIEYQHYHLNDPRPVNIFVTRMARGNENVTIESSIGQGKLISGAEQVSGMANRYDQAINYWRTWGNRNNVAVAINGYLFDRSSGVPLSGQVHSGWYAKRFTEYETQAGFAWMIDGGARIGSCVFHNQAKQLITFVDAGYSPKFQGINVEHDDENIILYTPQYDNDTNTSGAVLEILVEMTQPAALVASPKMVTGYIREIRESGGSTPLPFDHVVISAWGAVRDTILSRINSGAIAIGDEVGISQEISNCPSSDHQFDWSNTYAGVGGDFHFLNNNKIRTDFGGGDFAVPNARTAIGYNSSYIFFIVVDGKNPGVSEGLNIEELGYFIRDTLGATDAVSQDSGGSSTMVVNGEVVNNTYCNFTDCRPKKLPEESGMIAETQDGNVPRDVEILAPGSYDGSAVWNEAGVLEALVANGMMMVAVDPLAQSTTLSPSDVILTGAEAKIRLGPGTNYAHFDIIPPGNCVEVLPHMNGLNGVLAKGSYWWKVAYGGTTGWVREQDLDSLQADFTAWPSIGTPPLEVSFTDTSTGDYTDRLWTFHDGSTSTEVSPNKDYPATGVYSVTLEISGPGCTHHTLTDLSAVRVYDEVFPVYLPKVRR